MNDYYDDHDPAPESAAEERFPWPPAQDEALAPAFARTWRGAALEPRAFFRAMPAEAPLAPPILYYLVIGIAAAGARLFWALLGVGVDRQQDTVLDQSNLTMSPLIEFLLSPLLLLFSIFIAGAIVHALLKLFGGANHRYAFTTRVFAFAYSPAILEVVPVIGSITSFIWMTVVLIVGLKEGHGTSMGRVLAAVLIPLGIGLMIIVAATFLLATGELLRL